MDLDTLSFEEAFSLLEQTVGQLEQGALNLEEAVELFERGTQLVGRCNALLDSAELRISQLVPTAEEYRTTSFTVGE